MALTLPIIVYATSRQTAEKESIPNEYPQHSRGRFRVRYGSRGSGGRDCLATRGEDLWSARIRRERRDRNARDAAAQPSHRGADGRGDDREREVSLVGNATRHGERR